MTDVFEQVSWEDRCDVEVDAAQILDTVLDLRPLDDPDDGEVES